MPLRDWIPFARQPALIDRTVAMRLRPVRNSAIEWRANDDGEATLTVPNRQDRVGRFVTRWFRLPETRAVELDEVGAFVWNLCDGKLTVDGIVTRLCREYKMSRREAEISVTEFMRMLAERRFIGFYQKSATPARSGAETQSHAEKDV